MKRQIDQSAQDERIAKRQCTIIDNAPIIEQKEEILQKIPIPMINIIIEILKRNHGKSFDPVQKMFEGLLQDKGTIQVCNSIMMSHSTESLKSLQQKFKDLTNKHNLLAHIDQNTIEQGFYVFSLNLLDIIKKCSKEDLIELYNTSPTINKENVAKKIRESHTSGSRLTISDFNILDIILTIVNIEIKSLRLYPLRNDATKNKTLDCNDLSLIATQFPNLQSLSIDGNIHSVTTQCNSYSFSKLTSLNIANATYNPVVLQILEHCPVLESLAMNSIVIEDIAQFNTSISENFTNLTSLTQLTLEDISINDETIIIITEKFPNLISLSLYGCNQITSKGFQPLSKITTLSKLSLSSTTINNDALLKILDGCKSVKSLDLSACDKKIFSTIVLNQVNLQELDISYNTISQESFNCLIKSISDQVENLHLTSMGDLNEESDDDSIITDFSPIQQCKNLTKLTLDGNNIRDDELRQIIIDCTKLKFISVKGCDNITISNDKQELHEEDIKEIRISNTPLPATLITLTRNICYCLSQREIGNNVESLRSLSRTQHEYHSSL